MMMIFSMTSSFVFAEGMDPAAPVDEPTVEGEAVPEETPGEVTEPVAEGQEEEAVEEVKDTTVNSKLEGQEIYGRVKDLKAVLVNNTNSVKVTWDVVELEATVSSESAGTIVTLKKGDVELKSDTLASDAREYIRDNVEPGTYDVTVSIGSYVSDAVQITVPAVPEAITGFATYSAYKSVVLEWNKPATNPTRYEIYSDGEKIAEFVYPNVPGSPFDNAAVYNYQCTNAKDEKVHSYMIKAVNVAGDQEVSVQSGIDPLYDQMLMPMYINCTFKQTKVLKSHDKAKVKHKFRKGDVIRAHMFVKGQYRFYYNGNLFYCNYNRLGNKKALYNGYGNWNYSDREAEYFINTAGETSMTKYIIFVNLYTQHLYLLTGAPKSKGQWKVTTVNYKGKKYRDWEVASGKAATPTPGGLTLKFKRKPVNIYRKSGTVYGHKTKNWNFYHSQTALHGRVGKAIYGKPRSLGCIRNTDAQAIFIKKAIPMKTRVAIY